MANNNTSDELNRLSKESLVAMVLAMQDQLEKLNANRKHLIEQIAAIYHLDNKLSELASEERRKARQLTVKPLVEAYFAWAKEILKSNRLSKSKTLEGLNYCVNQEKALTEFWDDGDLPLDNNATEAALRTFCVHKHTWRLIDTIDGAKASAIVYSLTETAKANRLNPFRYLEFLLTELMEH